MKKTYTYDTHRDEFVPTYLYIKEHNVTGLKYFGKTVTDPLAYPGSGAYWRKHLAKHGNDVTTVWYQLFEDLESLKAYAEEFSASNNIVEDRSWANLMIENGLDGGSPKGRVLSDSTRKKLSEAGKGRIVSKHTKKKISESKKGKKRPEFSDEWKANLSANHASKQPGFEKIITNEQRKKISDTLRAKARPVYCSTNDTWYKGITDAAEQLGLSYNGVSHCVYGYQKRTGGYSFRF